MKNRETLSCGCFLFYTGYADCMDYSGLHRFFPVVWMVSRISWIALGHTDFVLSGFMRAVEKNKKE